MNADDLGFTYNVRKNGDVEIFHHGRLASTLRGKNAERFKQKATGENSPELQQLMARITGNYKRGNERQAGAHPRSRGYRICILSAPNSNSLPTADSLQLPADLITFLDRERQLKYDPSTCEAGAVTLLPRSALKLQAFGEVSGVDLIATCTGDYEPEGLLVWLPGERRFGVWDTSHDLLLAFSPNVSWSQIAYSPARFINAQWAFEDLERAPTELLETTKQR
jgi:hypothetical protein